jgi:3',5'-cyclic AMP phosphodiesterase CpdA
MACELADEDPVRFFYHLGDLVYLHGEDENYEPQFLSPYAQYSAPIFAVAGNHDGERAPAKRGHPLDPFVRRFCRPGPAIASAECRAVPQPNVYWTLEHDWVTIVGLYTDVPEGGLIGDEQARWLIGELEAARPEATLILAMHHPVYSADTAHGSNLALGERLDACFERAGRCPDLVLSAHAHNYQRFTRTYRGEAIPYVVAGSGGFHELHGVGYGLPDTPASFTGLPGLTLEAYQHAAFGFLTLTTGPEGTRVDYSTVVRRRPVRFDSVSLSPKRAI